MFALNSYQTLAVGILLYYLGKLLKQKIKFLQTYCIPNPVIGGVLFALLNLALFEAGNGAIKLDTVQQSFFMNMFFTSVGFSASYALLKKGGRDVFILTIVCAVLITFQNIIGVGVAKATGLHPLLGLCAALMLAVNTMLVTLVPLRLQSTGRISALSGLLNSATYAGSTLSGYGMGLLLERSGWPAALLGLCAGALAASLLCAAAARGWKRLRG